MNVAQLKRFCRAFPNAIETAYGEPYNFLVYSVGGRKFAYFKTSDPEKWRFSMRVTPDRFVELTDMPGVKPARYRGRYGWITIVDVSAFPRRISGSSWDRRTTEPRRRARHGESRDQTVDSAFATTGVVCASARAPRIISDSQLTSRVVYACWQASVRSAWSAPSSTR